MPCPDADAIAAFVCADCRRLTFRLASADAAPAMPGPHHIGRFEVIAPIGGGAMGRVVRARDPEAERWLRGRP